MESIRHILRTKKYIKSISRLISYALTNNSVNKLLKEKWQDERRNINKLTSTGVCTKNTLTSKRSLKTRTSYRWTMIRMTLVERRRQVQIRRRRQRQPLSLDSNLPPPNLGQAKTKLLNSRRERARKLAVRLHRQQVNPREGTQHWLTIRI